MTSGRPAFQQHVKRAEGSDTTPRLAHAENHERRMYKSTISTKAKRSRSPAGPRRLRNSDAHKRIAAPKAFCVLQERLRPRPKSGKTCRSDTRPGDVRERAERSEGSDTTPVRNAPVSPCVPLCAIFLRKASVYPLSPVKANVGHLCERLKNAMKSGWGQRCGGNFSAIFAGVSIGEKPNFTGRFFGWRRPFDFSTDRL